MNLETSIMTTKMTTEFLKWFNYYIGTDFEINSDPSGKGNGKYVVVFELIVSEFAKVQKWLDTQHIESYNI